MKFPPSLLEEIKARLPVSAVVGKRVRLAKAGREWKGLSPFNAEKTPSFFVNDHKASFFDFSSGKNGDIFKFVMETEGLSFPEAVEKLAAEAGVTLPKITQEAQVQEERRKGLHEVVELAARFFEAELMGDRGGQARRYLASRGLDGEARTRFRLGYGPAERFALRDHLAGKGVSAELMMEAGLLVHGEEIAVPYDRFRDRIMFPIHDSRGRVVAFGGRAMSAEVSAKYLNSPETPLFHKGSLLYNAFSAREAAHKANRVIAVEGYVDVIAMVTRRLPADGCAARNRSDRRPAHAALAHGRRAGDLPRRRQGRPQGREPRDRPRLAAAGARQVALLRAAAGGAGPRRSRPLRR